jgi:hypothetical protein
MHSSEIESYVDAAAAALALPLAAEHRPGVLRYFALAAGMAELVMAQALRADDEPAPQFVPIGPGDAPLLDRKRLK